MKYTRRMYKDPIKNVKFTLISYCPECKDAMRKDLKYFQTLLRLKYTKIKD